MFNNAIMERFYGKIGEADKKTWIFLEKLSENRTSQNLVGHLIQTEMGIV